MGYYLKLDQYERNKEKDEELKMEFNHISILLKETMEYLNLKPEGIYIDGTLGGGGHTYEICKRISDQARVIGIDQDEDAIKAAKDRLKEFGNKITIVQSNYSEIQSVMTQLNIEKADGILLDLGVSSYQLDTIERGFSYKENAPLDMRMDRRQDKTAKDIINQYTEQELYEIIRDYGEDKFAKNIAKHIVRVRKDKPLETTYELVDVIKAAIPMKIRMKTGHPAKKTFQAIRIELNQELTVLKNTLSSMVDLLNDQGRICVITFHSLEDRIVKNCFRLEENPCTCPSSFPICVCGNKPRGKIITRKPILPSEEELMHNSRSKSAKLRVFERIY